MTTIRRVPVTYCTEQTIQLPEEHTILFVANEDDMPQLWIAVNLDSPTISKKIYVTDTPLLALKAKAYWGLGFSYIPHI